MGADARPVNPCFVVVHRVVREDVGGPTARWVRTPLRIGIVTGDLIASPVAAGGAHPPREAVLAAASEGGPPCPFEEGGSQGWTLVETFRHGGLNCRLQRALITLSAVVDYVSFMEAANDEGVIWWALCVGRWMRRDLLLQPLDAAKNGPAVRLAIRPPTSGTTPEAVTAVPGLCTWSAGRPAPVQRALDPAGAAESSRDRWGFQSLPSGFRANTYLFRKGLLQINTGNKISFGIELVTPEFLVAAVLLDASRTLATSQENQCLALRSTGFVNEVAAGDRSILDAATARMHLTAAPLASSYLRAAAEALAVLLFFALLMSWAAA